MQGIHILRRADLSYLVSGVAKGMCTALVGLSNTGKSAMLRTLAEPGLADVILGEAKDFSPSAVYCYIDCNRMLEMSAQGFYEVTLRALLTTLPGPNPPTPLSLRERGAPLSPDLGEGGEGAGMVEHIWACYQEVLEGSSPFRIALSFNEALAAAATGSGRLALLFDEFDEALATLDARVFLNLRALYDQFDGRLCYVTATSSPLGQIRPLEEVGEFCELFEGRLRWLSMLSPDEARTVAAEYAGRTGVRLDDEELDFIIGQAGGHPGLLQAVTAALLRAGANFPTSLREQTFTWLAARLEEDELVRNECTKLWRQLSPPEQEGLYVLLRSLVSSAQEGGKGQEGEQVPALAALREKSILVGEPPRIFSRLFEAYARRRATAHTLARGVRVDIESGEVAVDGRPVPTLTDLEYRLLLLLYGRMDKLCDKYQIVEAVWGQEYIDEVDDARIEKLVSRLRAKLEPDPANPRYLLTLRGRGYKLVRG